MKQLQDIVILEQSSCEGERWVRKKLCHIIIIIISGF